MDENVPKYDFIETPKIPYPLKLNINDLTRNLEQKQVRQLDHDNLNKFVGVCVDSPIFYLGLWRCCKRGSVKVIQI
jgi:guanylate cyclase/atrial natriuretic peptide receptor A